MSLREEWFIVIEQHDMKKLCLWKTLNRSSTSGKECRTTQAKGGSITKSHTPETHQYLEEVPVLGESIPAVLSNVSGSRKHSGESILGSVLVLSWCCPGFLVISWWSPGCRGGHLLVFWLSLSSLLVVSFSWSLSCLSSWSSWSSCSSRVVTTTASVHIQRAQYPLIKEYSLNHNMKPLMI